MLACRPSTSMSRLWAPIWASARSRRPIRNALVSGKTSPAIASVAIGGVGVVGDRRVAVFGNHDDLLPAISACPVLPDPRFQHQNHAGWEDEVIVELLTEIRSDHGRFGGVGTDGVG